MSGFRAFREEPRCDIICHAALWVGDLVMIPGSRLGSFEIVAALGAGGMGEVYRARDTKLKREVALKILPDAFAQNAERLARFQREAEVLASLNHPHIAQIYGVEESAASTSSGQAAVHAIVMELVEGEDLSQRLARSPIPLAEALPIARQITEALEAAHDHGVIHRDLKPANIKVRDDGTVKVLDFGLAKLVQVGRDFSLADPGQAAEAEAPALQTMTSPAALSAQGIILGTAAYMSPEQARGKPVNRKADIWAFGCVLFEMLTGERAFKGDTVTDVLAAVVDKEPAWSALPAATPATIRRLLQRCLEKDLMRRLPHIGAARLELEDASVGRAGDAAGTPAQHEGVTRWRWVSASLGILALAALALAAYALTRPAARATGAAQRLVIMLPPDVRLTRTDGSGVNHQVALSPDDRQLVFAGTRGTVTQLYVRRLDQYDVRPLPGTENATVPFFSPDGSWVGFHSGGQLRKVSLAGAGGIPEVICHLPGAISAAAWGADGEIVFASRAGLSRVAAVGGTPEALTTLLPGELAHNAPHLLPGGRILFTVVTSAVGQAQRSQTAVLSKTTRERHPVLDDALGGRSLASGHLVFFRAGSLWTVPFDAARGVVEGTPVPRANDVFVSGVTSGSGSYAASARSLLYVPGGLDGTLMWVERDGRTSPLFDERGAFQHPMLSPDGTRVAFDAGRQDAKDLWVYDVPRGTRIRLTTSDGTDVVPIWTPDGTAVAYGCNNDLCRISANGGGQPESLLRRAYSQTPTSWSPDGRILVYSEVHPKTGQDVWAWQPGEEPTPVMTTPFNESGAVFSPDGRFLAYVSDESGHREIYVRPYPKGTEKWLISTNGGAEPVWSLDGRELFYRENDTMMAVPVTLRPIFKAGVTRRLFDGRFDSSNIHQHYSAGGGRFLKVQRDQDVGTGRLHVILNFVEELDASKK